MKEKLKSWLADDALYMALLVLGVGILSFMLGRVSVVSVAADSTEGVNPITYCAPALCPTETMVLAKALDSPSSAVVPAMAEAAVKPFVASKSGTKYHHVSCPGAKQIKETNKLYFATALEAQAAGYSKAVNCNYE